MLLQGVQVETVEGGGHGVEGQKSLGAFPAERQGGQARDQAGQVVDQRVLAAEHSSLQTDQRSH